MCIVIHHGGKWVNNPKLSYFGGDVKLVNDLPSDLSPRYLRTLINSLGYNNIIKTHYCDPLKDIQQGIMFLGYDDTTFGMFISLLKEYRMLDVFTEHDEELIEDITIEQPEAFVEELEFIEDLTTEEAEFIEDLNTEHSEFIDDLTAQSHLFEHSGRASGSNMIGEIDYDEEGSDNEDDEVREARMMIQQEKKKEKSFEDEVKSLRRLAERKGKDIEEGSSDYEGESSEFESPPNSEDEDDYGYLLAQPCPKKKQKARKTIVTSDGGLLEQDCPFYLGQEFENAVEFRDAVTNYCLSVGRDTYFTRNDAKKLGARCKAEKCPFYVYTSLIRGKGHLIVKTLVPQHNCGRLPVVKKIRAAWIAKIYHQKFKINPYIKCQEIVDTLWAEKGVKASLWLALKARRKAQGLILGEYKEQYGLLNRYAEEIKRTNPMNTIKFKLNNGVFKSLYVCFNAIKKGFLAGCRPFFGIDGCFLKGPFGGQLLVAVGRDGNNQMFPIAWACVEVEDTETWSWFLQLLADDLGTSDGHGYTIMSDQQKGLLRAVSLIWPKADTRCCARHVYCNFRQVFGGGVQYRRGFWKIAKSTTEAEYDSNMQLFANISKEAASDLKKRNYKKWVRAFFTTTSHCDCIDNNMNEVFNAYILSSRHKPIITMLEDIREGLMERLHKKRDFIANKEVDICPRIKAKLEKSKVDARGWLAFWDGHFCYGVREGLSQTRYVVSLLERTCSCNAWQLSGVPCNHAVAAIWKAKEMPEHYLSHYFSKNTYLKAYEFPLEPLNGPQDWPQSPYASIVAPPVKKIHNRPTVKRKPSVGEVTGTRLTKKGITMRCSNCGEAGHNKRKCSAPLKADQPPKAPKQPKQNAPKQKKRDASVATSTQQSHHTVPMHNGGVGVFSYSNGFQRQATNVMCFL